MTIRTVGRQGKAPRSEDARSVRHYRHTRDTVGLAPEAHRPKIRRQLATRTRTAEDAGKNRSARGGDGDGESGLGVPAHLGSTFESRPSNRSRHGSEHSAEEWH